MTAAFLQSELASLIQDSKRKQSDVRTAAERSLADLKAIQVTSETQLAGDLLRRPQFIDPFLLACTSKYVKLAVTGAICLQRLVASRAISPSRLADVLDAFQEATQQGLDVQLKILQALPSLLQLYATELYGDALAKVLSLCANLAGSKTAVVSSAAIATFQQLITGLFEAPARRGSQSDNHNEGEEDAANVFHDMCLIIRGEHPQYLRAQGLTLPLALEVVELAISAPRFEILSTSVCLDACKSSLIPGMIHVLDKSGSFQAFGRSLRVLYLLLTREFDRVYANLGSILVTVLNIMDRPLGPPWRRILCLEFMRNVMADARTFRMLYSYFDCKKDQKSIIGPFMSIMVRIAAEDPALIGLGRQSTIPTNSASDNANTGGGQIDVDAVGSVLQANSSVTGISSRWSTLASPLLDQLDRPSLADIPETYIYTIVLGCVASLSDGLSKYVMPLSVPNRAIMEALDAVESNGSPSRKNSFARRVEKYQRLLNPLKREDLSNMEDVETCARLIEECWPAVLATCSTFLNSALDSHFYHILVRTVQKLAQVSGVLELLTPRDALLTTLAKVSVPVNASSMVTALHGNKLAKVMPEERTDEADDASIKSPIPTTPRMSIDVSRQPLNVRNLLCLRALLNLGIALGPTLTEASWFIIIQALQQADALMSVNPAARNAASKAQTQDDPEVDDQTSLGSEFTAVGTASKRMMESTRTYSDEMLEVLLNSVFKMIETLIPDVRKDQKGEITGSKQPMQSLKSKHRATRSVSGSLSSAVVLYVEAEFVLKTVNDLARINLHRFCSVSSQSCTWVSVVTRLLSLVADADIDSQLRLQAGRVLNAVSMEAMRMLGKQEHNAEDLYELQTLCLNALAQQLSLLYNNDRRQTSLVTDVEIHRRMLEALEDIVSHSGDSLTSGWRIVFEILQKSTRQTDARADKIQESDLQLILERTIPPAFRTVQLIVSDFLNTIDPISFSILIELLPCFGAQENDLNISLTTTVLFSNLSALLLERTDMIDTSLMPTALGMEMDPALADDGHADVSSLWFAIVLQLCGLCKDHRSDVRNSALRVLFRVFESSGPQLSAVTWNRSLQDAVLPVLKEYSSKQEDILPWHTSYTYFLQGIVQLVVQNIDVITNCSVFTDTWKALSAALTAKLAEKRLEGHTVVFQSFTELLNALNATSMETKDYVLPVLQCWLDNHPAGIEVVDKSNQDALYAHIQLFSAITRKKGTNIHQFIRAYQDLPDQALDVIREAVLSSVHPPYSSDVNKLAPEQVAIVDALSIIKEMMISNRQRYTRFILGLIADILTRNSVTAVEQKLLNTSSKSPKRPTLIALMGHCISSFRSVIREESDSNEFLRNISATEAVLTLTKVVVTKYKDIPTSDPPAWQSATDGITELIEALQVHLEQASTENIEMLSLPLVRAFDAIMTAPALETKKQALTSEIVDRDEAFDVERGARFHKALRQLLQLSSFPIQNRKENMTTLFQASLIAKPWYGDLPPDLLNAPLAALKDVRAGTIRPPDFFPRARLPYQALDTLLGLVDRSTTTTSSSSSKPSIVTATAAAPYILLRVAHSIKTFLADQRLRNLTPPPRPVLRELNVILTKALHLRVVDEAFVEILPSKAEADSVVGTGASDGKTHLRILYPLVLRLKEFWIGLPRVKVCAWQDTEDGRAVREVLDRWGLVLAEGWSI